MPLLAQTRLNTSGKQKNPNNKHGFILPKLWWSGQTPENPIKVMTGVSEIAIIKLPNK